MNPTSSATESGHRKLLVCDAGDIHRAMIHLFTHRTLARVEFHIDTVPPVVLQRAQHHVTRISAARNGAFGAGLAAATFLVGTAWMWVSFDSLIWTPKQLWQNLGLLTITVAYAGLIGAGVEVVWRRLKLMRVLWRLRRRLVVGKTFKDPGIYTGRVSAPRAAVVTAALDSADHGHRMRSPLFSRPKRPSVLLHDVADVRRLIIHLLTRWTLPRVRISVDGVATLDVQRAQHRIVRLSETCNCLLGACLAAVTLLGGAFYVEWTSIHSWDWAVPQSWGPLGLVFVAAPAAALVGTAMERIWNRVRLMLVLHGVRHRLRA
jgi:hypothetical protein